MPNEYDDLIDNSKAIKPVNEYDEIITQESSEISSGLKRSMFTAVKKNPEQQAKVISLAEKTGLPADTVERNTPEVESKLKFESNDYDALIENNPILSKNLSDPNFASIAHDDIENLSFWEVLGNSAKNTPRSLLNAGTGIADLGRSLPGGLVEAIGMGLRGTADINDAFGRNIMRAAGLDTTVEPDSFLANPIFNKYLTPSAILRGPGEVLGDVAEGVKPPEERQNLATDILGGVGQITGQIAMSLVNPGVGLTMLFGQGADQQAQRADAEGATQEEKDQAVLTGSAVTGITEKIGLDALLNRLPPKIKNNIVRQFTDIGIAGGIEALQEAAEGVLHNLIALNIYDEDAQLIEGIEREAYAAGGAGALFRAIINAFIPGRMSGTEYKKQQSQSGVTNKEFLDQIGNSAKESKLRERSPAKYQKLIAESLEGSGIENVGIPSDQLQTFFQENPDAFNDFSENIEGFEEALAEAAALGEDVQIPTDVLAAHIASQDYYDLLSQDIRLNPDSMTARESESFNAESAAQLQADYEQYASQIVSDFEGQVSGDAVFNDVKEQLIAAGQPEDIADKNAAIHKAFFETMAARTGTDAFSLYQGQNLKIRSENKRDALDSVIDSLRSGKGPTETQALGPTLIEFLRDAGGVRDDAGELAARDIDKGKKAFARNLIQDEGMELDAAVQAAVDAGFIPAPDPNSPTDFGINELLDAIESKGLKVRYYKSGDKDSRLKAVSGFKTILFQDTVPRGTKKRGRIIFTGDTTIIDLFKDANLSTFLHESGHLFLNAYASIASQDEAPQQIRDDMRAILDWLEVDSIEALDPASNGDAAVAAQEKWARGIEAYLREGKAPSSSLQAAFQRFKSWLLNVYRSIQNLDVELNDEIRAVMDRMLATDDEINASKERNNIRSVFEADSDITAEQASSINQVNNDALETAKEKLLVKLLAEITREKKRWWKDEKSNVRKEVEQEFQDKREFKVKHWLQTGTLFDGSEIGIDPVKLSRNHLIAMYGSGSNALWRKLPFGKNSVWSSDGGIHPDVIAEVFGFTSGDQMVRAMIDSGNINTAINEETQARMLNKHGDILNDGTIEAEADEAMHNVNSAKAMLNDINELNRRTGRNNSPAQAFKMIAKDIVGDRQIKDISAAKVLQNERRITDRLLKAIEAGDDNAALKLANQRLINHQMYLVSRDAMETANKIQARMKKFNNKKTQQKIGKAGGDYLEQILHLLELVEFRKSVSVAKQGRAKSYALWVKEQEDADAPVIVNEKLLEQSQKKHWRTMTFNELIGFDDTIKNIEHIANVKNKLIVGKEKRDLNEVADGVIENIINNIEHKKTVFNTRTKKEGAKRTINQFLGTLVKAQTRIEIMDGGQKIGKVYDALKKHIDAGEIARFHRIQIESDRFFKIVSDFYGTGIKLGEKEIANTFEKLSSSSTAVYIPEIETSLTKEERLMVALNLGTEKNRQRFVDGRGLNDAQIDAILGTLDANDANFVQAIWDFNDSFWPEIAELEQKRTGVKPEKQEAVPITIADVNLRGGYIPIKFDAAKDVKALQIDEEQTFKDMRSGRNSRAQTRRGFTKARVEGDVTIAVRVDFGVLQEHMNEVITDLTMGEAIEAAYKVLHHNGVKTAIQNHLGSDVFQEMDIWLEDTAVGSVKAAAGMSQVFKGLRASVTIGAMGWKVATSLIQVSGFSQSFVEVGYKPMAKGIAKFIQSVGNRSIIDSVFEKSGFMRERSTTFQRDIRDALTRLEGDGLINNFQKTLFWPIIKMQQMVDIPTWMGAYEKGIDVGHERGLTEDALDSFAINFADQAVENSQGTGLFKGLSAIERGTLDKQTRTTEIVKLWTTFYSYFNTKLNIAYRQTKGTNFRSPQEVAILASDYLMLFWIEALIGEFMLGRMPDFEDDDDSLLWYNMKLILSTIAGTIPVLREMSSVLQGFGAAPGGVRGIETLGRGISTVSSIVEDIANGEDIDLLKVAQPIISAVNVISPVKYPSGQINVTLEAIRRSNEGEDVDPIDYLIRPPANR